MREVVARKHPVSIHGAEVLDLELDKRPRQFGTVSKVAREGVGLELEATAENVHHELNDGIHGPQHVREENESDDDRVLLDEAKVGIERVVVDEDRKECEDVEEMDLRVCISALQLGAGVAAAIPEKCRRDG